MVLDCFNTLNDETLTESERVFACLCNFLGDIKDESEILNLPDYEDTVMEMFKFFNCGQEEDKKPQRFVLINWEKDESLICSAVNKVAGKEIRLEPYVHWWTFMGYYVAIGESALATIVGIRNKQNKGKKLEKHEMQFVLENPQYFNWDRRTLQEKADDEWLESVWNSDKKDSDE